MTTTTPTATQGSLTTSLADLAASNEKLTEQFNAAQIALVAARHRADQAKGAAATMRARLSVAQHALAVSLAQQYKGSGFGSTGALLSSDSGQAYLERMQTLSQLAQHQTEVANAAASANTRASAAVAEAQRAVTTAQHSSDEVAAQRASLQKRITRYQSMLATLTANERTAFFGSNNATQSEIDLALASYTIGATPADVIAVRTALSELGKPYVWAASGPSSFDCSGLTMTAWAAAGVSLPHLASSQQSMGTPVDRSQLRPGDLVFFGSPAYHVAIYMGSGMIIQAPQTGDVVKITPLAAMSDYSGAGRFG